MGVDMNFDPYEASVRETQKEKEPAQPKKKPSDGTASSKPKGESDEGRRHTVSLNAEQWKRLRRMQGCIAVAEGLAVPVGELFMEGAEAALAAHPGALKLYRDSEYDGSCR